MTATKGAKDMSWVPPLPGWVSLPAAGIRLGVSRQLMFQMAQAHQLDSLRQLPGAGDRPAAYAITEEELEQLLARKTVPTEVSAATEAAPDPASVAA